MKELINRSPKHVKVFISTRSFRVIEDDLRSFPSIEVTPERNKADVCEFIETTLDKNINDKELLNGVVEPELRREVRDTLVRHSGNVFLHASLLLNQLCDKGPLTMQIA